MALAQSASPVSVNSQSETEIVSWTADGAKEFIGFLAAGPIPAEYRLYVEGTRVYPYQTTPEDLTAFIVDKPYVPANGTIFSLKVYHESPTAESFFGTILGG